MAISHFGKGTVYIDEVGVGPLAGPVTVCAVYVGFPIPHMLRRGITKTLRDSKQLSPAMRETLYRQFSAMPNLIYTTSYVTPTVIDRINIFQATRRAAKRALLAVEEQMGGQADNVVLDGRLHVALPRSQQSIPKADETIVGCAVASIIAKVTRDRMMQRYHKKYPSYRFDLHKGYGTKLHKAMLRKHGPSPIHRATFS